MANEAEDYIKKIIENHENRLVYDEKAAALSKKKRKPMIEIYTSLRKDYKDNGR